jgi:hypothetical protein
MTMKSLSLTGATLWVAMACAAPAFADFWDVGSPNDNTVATQNELLHGSRQTHDLASQPAADQDWYRLGQAAYSSWEVVVDGVTANAGFAVALERIGSDGTTVVQSSAPTSSLGYSRSLRWANASSTAVTNQYVRARSTTCTTNCTANDVYQLRVFETTLAVPRFNNSGTQATVLTVQNTATYDVGGTIYFWKADGTLHGTAPLAVFPSTKIPAKQLMVLSLPGVPGLAGQSGSITIVHDGRYGDLVGKAVSLETSTGYTFDTPLVGRP